jgi:hypothetical protein
MGCIIRAGLPGTPYPTFYLVSGHSRSAQTALQFVSDLLSWSEVAVTGKPEALHANQSGMNDFEDALRVAAPVACGASVIVTRNTHDFLASPIPVMTPEQLLAHLSTLGASSP